MKSFDLLNNHGELDKGSVDFFNEKSVRETEKNGYSVLHIITQVLFWAENQSNHQNWGPSMLPLNYLNDLNDNERRKE